MHMVTDDMKIVLFSGLNWMCVYTTYLFRSPLPYEQRALEYENRREPKDVLWIVIDDYAVMLQPAMRAEWL